MAITIGNLLLAATVLSTLDFESAKLGEPGLARSWGGGDHNGYVTNVKAHGGTNSFCLVTGGKAGQQAMAHVIFDASRQGTEPLKSGYLRFAYWFCPETENAGFDTELRTNTSRNLFWRTSAAGFRMNAGYLDKSKRKLPDWSCAKRCEIGKWHRVEVDIPVNPEEKLNARIRVTWPDGSVETGETDYDHRPGTTTFCWMPIVDPWATNMRFHLDDFETIWVNATAISWQPDSFGQ